MEFIKHIFIFSESFYKLQIQVQKYSLYQSKMSYSRTNAYVLNQKGDYTPFNIVSVGGVRCLHCNQIIDPKQYSNHARMHIPNRNLIPDDPQNKNHSHPKKVNLENLMSDKENNETDVSVQSFFPTEMPGDQKQRKQQNNKKPPLSQSFNDQIFLPACSINTDENFNNDIVCEDDYIEREIEKSIHIKKDVDIFKENHKIKKKNPNYYRNNNTGHAFHDRAEQNKKLQKQRSENIAEAETYSVDEWKKTQNQKEPLVIQIGFGKKNIGRKEKVGVISTKTVNYNSYLKPNKPQHSEQPKTQIGQSQDYHEHNKFECRACHGFYCQQCGSDIPPKYRPVSLARQASDQEIQNFYRHHVNPRTKKRQAECQTCEQNNKF